MKRTFVRFSVEQFGKAQYVVEIEKADALDAIDYLKQHNGDAPSTVHDLIRGMEVACRLAKPVEVES